MWTCHTSAVPVVCPAGVAPAQYCRQMSYYGDFTIITGDGSEFEVTGQLVEDSSGPLKSWSGTASGDPSVAAAFGRGMARVCLPDGGEGEVLVSGVRDSMRGDAQVVVLKLRGSGPPPF